MHQAKTFVLPDVTHIHVSPVKEVQLCWLWLNLAEIWNMCGVTKFQPDSAKMNRVIPLLQVEPVWGSQKEVQLHTVERIFRVIPPLQVKHVYRRSWNGREGIHGLFNGI